MAEEKGEFDFVKMRGKAVQVSTGGSHFVCVNGNNVMWCQQAEGDDISGKWTRLQEEVQHGAVGDDGTIFYCDMDGKIHKKGWEDEEFEDVRGACVQIDVGNAEEVVCVNENGKIWKYKPEDGRWTKLPGAGTQASIGNDGTIWCVNESNHIYSWDPDSDEWTRVPGRASQVAVGDAGNILAVSTNGTVYRWNGDGWDACDGFEEPPQYISTAATGTTMIAKDNNTLHCHMEVAGWEQLPGHADRIMVGAADHIMCVNEGNNLYRFSGEEWERLPGSAIAADIGDDGEMWAVNENEKIFRWTGEEWEKQRGAAVKISVACENVVCVVNSNDVLWRFRPEDGRWDKLDGDVDNACITTDGEIWYIQKETQEIYRLEEGSEDAFEQVPGRAVHISAGDEDSVLCVNEAGKTYRLTEHGQRRKNPHWAQDMDLKDVGDSIRIGSDGTLVKCDGDNNIHVLYGDDDNEEDDEEGEAEEWDVDDEENMGRVRAERRRARNAASRRKQIIARSQRRRRQVKRAAGVEITVTVRPGVRGRGERRARRRARRRG